MTTWVSLHRRTGIVFHKTGNVTFLNRGKRSAGWVTKSNSNLVGGKHGKRELVFRENNRWARGNLEGLEENKQITA